MKIHSIKCEEKIRKSLGYISHDYLRSEEMKIIVDEVYNIHLIVQKFLSKLSEKEKNYINIVEQTYQDAYNDYKKIRYNSYLNNNHYYYNSIKVYNMANQNYINKYNSQPPIINFKILYE